MEKSFLQKVKSPKVWGLCSAAIWEVIVMPKKESTLEELNKEKKEIDEQFDRVEAFKNRAIEFGVNFADETLLKKYQWIIGMVLKEGKNDAKKKVIEVLQKGTAFQRPPSFNVDEKTAQFYDAINDKSKTVSAEPIKINVEKK